MGSKPYFEFYLPIIKHTQKITAVEKSRVAMRYSGLLKVEYAGWTAAADIGWSARYPTFARPPYLSPRNIL